MYKLQTVIDVLDHGTVEIINVMGTDADIANSARVSTQAQNDTVKDRELIRYLMRHQHTSPFEFCEVVFKIKLPIFVARQMIRHRTANVNEVSGRYTVLPTEFYIPDIERIAGKGKINIQGSEGEVDEIYKTTWIDSLERHAGRNEDLYNMANSFGISNELARISLPVSTYTLWVWKMDLHNIFHFLKLRMDSHAQWEMQQYANAMYELLKEKFPIACEAFEDYMLNAVTFSKQEMEILKKYKNFDDIDLQSKFVLNLIPNNLERTEFKNKMNKEMN
jgi:thymidylate synthase (FAD)